MSDSSSTASTRKPKKSEVIEDAVVVEDEVVVVDAPAEPATPVVVETITEPAPAPTPAPAQAASG